MYVVVQLYLKMMIVFYICNLSGYAQNNNNGSTVDVGVYLNWKLQLNSQMLEICTSRTRISSSVHCCLFLEDKFDESGVEIVSDILVSFLLQDKIVFEPVDFLLQFLNGTFGEFSTGFSLL